MNAAFQPELLLYLWERYAVCYERSRGPNDVNLRNARFPNFHRAEGQIASKMHYGMAGDAQGRQVVQMIAVWLYDVVHLHMFDCPMTAVPTRVIVSL